MPIWNKLHFISLFCFTFILQYLSQWWSVRMNEKTRRRVDNVWNCVSTYVLKVRTAVLHHHLLLFLFSFIYLHIGVYERYRRFVLLCCSFFFLQFCPDGLSLAAKWSRRRRRRRRKKKRRRRCQHQHRRLNIFAL